MIGGEPYTLGLFDTAGQANNTTYNVSVTGAVTDVAGNPLNAAPYNFSYTTTPGDVTPPNVSSTTPTNGATGVALDGTVLMRVAVGTADITLVVDDILLVRATAPLEA